MWVIGCDTYGNDHGIWIWDEQVASPGNSSVSIPKEWGWLPTNGAANVITGGVPDAYASPWVIQSNNTIWERSRTTP
jgi:hypothetical protein